MILAAGLGERMRPLSDGRAKPALPVLDEPLVARLVRKLAASGVEGVIVNTHAYPESLRAVLAGAPVPIEFSHEPEPLGSGGGIRAARSMLGDGRFLVVNGDMCLDLDVAAFVEMHERSGHIATLGLRDDPRKRRFGSIGYDGRAKVCRITELIRTTPEKGSGLFIGAQVMEPAIFDHMPDRETFQVFPDVYVPLLEQGAEVGVWLQPLDARWWPVGSPAELLDANLSALRSLDQLEPGVIREGEEARVEGEVRGPAWIGAGARIEAGAQVGPWAIVGHAAHVPAGWSIASSLWLPEARPEEPPHEVERAIAFDTGVWIDD